MSRAVQASAPDTRPREGSLDEVGACLCAIRAMSTHNGAIDEEDARAIYSLACIALTEWRLLDAADDMPRVAR